MQDEELARALAAAVRGDAAAFAVLWRAHQPPMLRYLRVIVGDSAEDVASETWLQAARDLRGFTGSPAGFRVWLFTIARNRAIDERRRARRRPEEPREIHERDLPGTRPDVAEEVVQRSETDWALGVIASLPKDQAEAVTLRVVVGLDVAQTADVLGKRPGAVRVAAMRGLRRLAQHAEVRARRPEPDHPEGV
ncbi:RNA polymerase sigma factor [Phytohabitans sp. ZYX-F-186]|uniref:RNA polymerase sigma factor n=1 Tax=Phytohabitans maris TaxID=3071409 RepID=A0ABU0ZS64_9ACTN|nr:RNA polymerase sigma factor [Phytohabitans sp. ZYX-F-186]MDQ7909866.1 RNA polymerase sigma factor [Phytohabitans sp. ZYX-F-186]